MKKLIAALGMFVISFTLVQSGYAQCENWNNSPQKDEAENQHVLYRGFIKEKNYEQAYDHWKVAYEIAPAADGRRSSHFNDGVDIFMYKFEKATDAAEKKAHSAKVLELYDEWVSCYPNETAYARGRQAYNMFYKLNTPYSKTLAVLKEAVEKGGNKTEYIVYDPYARIVVKQFQDGKMPAEEARNVYETLNAIADYNIANDKTYGPYHQQGKEAMNAVFSVIERDIFDCDYFKNKYLPEYKAEPNNPDIYRKVYKYLVLGGCDKSDPIVAEIHLKDSIYVMTEFYTKNPGAHANALYKSGDYHGAIGKYKEAIEVEVDEDKKAGYWFSIASIEFRKLKRKSSARSSALKAAKLRSGWGQPYLLIGDMYASSASSCGNDAFEKQMVSLAAIDKYAYAKSIDSDPEVQSEANKKIGRYSSFKPDKGEGHMRGVEAGDTFTIGCWIGEKVRVRFK